MVKNCKKIFSKNYGVQGSLALMLDNFTDERCSNLQEKLILIKELKKEGVETLHVTEKDLNYLTFRNNFMYYKNRPVFLLYYRWYYNAEHYSEEFIKIRIRIEQSNTISLPSAEAQLIGSKFFQLIFNDEEILRKYINEQNISDIKNIFTVYKSIEEYKIGDEDEYLIKSYSEGGNNILESPNENCFLMKRINSITRHNEFINGQTGETIPEVGIFGIFLSFNNLILINDSAGYICRSKMKESKECGVSCGFGALDSLELTDE